MSTETSPTSPIPALADAPASLNPLEQPDLQPNESESFPPWPSTPPNCTSFVPVHPTTDDDHEPEEVQEEYTLSAYGDISLDDDTDPSPSSPSSLPSPLQSRFAHIRLRLRRPPMPKHRISYVYVPGPAPHTAAKGPDVRSPVSPKPAAVANNPPRPQHQPTVSPPVDPTTPTRSSRTKRDKSVKKGGSTLRKFFDELLPRPSSIRLSPPGSPACLPLSLPQESVVRQEQSVRKSDNAAKLQQSPAPRKDKPKSAAWRTRLPPRLPIPKWDM